SPPAGVSGRSPTDAKPGAVDDAFAAGKAYGVVGVVCALVGGKPDDGVGVVGVECALCPPANAGTTSVIGAVTTFAGEVEAIGSGLAAFGAVAAFGFAAVPALASAAARFAPAEPPTGGGFVGGFENAVGDSPPADRVPADAAVMLCGG